MRGRNQGLVVGLIVGLCSTGVLVAVVSLGASSHGTLGPGETVSASSGGHSITLNSVSSDELMARGISLAQLDSSQEASVTVSSSAAVEDALQEYPGSSVVENVQASVTDSFVPAVDGCVCWIVSIVPPGGIHPVGGGPANATESPITGTYFLVFIDATSGVFRFGASGVDVDAPHSNPAPAVSTR